MRDYLYLLDGPAQHEVVQVRREATTMATFRYEGGDWGVYDHTLGFIDAVRLHETGLFVASTTEVMRGAVEAHRARFDGVL